ncbi:MAG: DUF4838 domain-containing protein [Phycisphaerae bacterium]|nr:DUF4838 domain-containing protein [Phycisphaerae bacterium]
MRPPLLLRWLVLFSSSLALADTVVLRDSTGPRFAIVVPNDASSDETAAAEELRHYLARICGADFAVKTEPVQGPTILVARADRLPDVKAESLGPDGLLIDVTPDAIRLIGGDDRGVRYAVTTFLEDLGVRWLMPGDFGEVVPNRPALTAQTHRRFERPDFPFRQIWYAYGAQTPAGGQRLAEWCRRNKVGRILINHGHNLCASLPKDVTLANHPEYFALVSGRRERSQLCTTHPDVIRLVTQQVIKYFDQYPDVLAYSLCPDDNTDFCQCDRCKALDVGGVDPYTKQELVTDRYMHFLNAVARGIQSKHPGKMVLTYAYVNYSIPPQKVEIDPHVAVMFTTSVFCSIHGIGDTQCKSRMAMKELLAGWAAKASQVYIYEYDPIPYNAELPCPLYGARIREMPVYKAMGIRGFSFESHQSWATLSPNHYIAAKMMWNTRADGQALLKDYCDAFFGPAGAAMLGYYTAQERAFSAYPGQVEWSQRDFPELFSEPIVSEMHRCLQAAEAAAKEPPHRDRVGMTRMAYDYLRRYLAARRESVGGTYETFRRESAAAEAVVDRMAKANEDFILAKVAREYLRNELGSAAAGAFSKDMGLVTNWWLIGPFDNAGMTGHERAYPPQREIDLNATYDGKAGKVRWQRYEGPPWKGYVDLAALMKPKDWVCAYAMTHVVSPSRRQVQLRVGSNDSIVIFLGDNKIHDNKVERRAKIDEDVVPVTLDKGPNTILLKIAQTGRDWGFFFRITSTQGQLDKDLRFTLGD